ncbi:MAG TPA: ATP-binding protein [Candidatus Limnocylindrales bacterium]|jgi:signal transduction histidine kinase
MVERTVDAERDDELPAATATGDAGPDPEAAPAAAGSDAAPAASLDAAPAASLDGEAAFDGQQLLDGEHALEGLPGYDELFDTTPSDGPLAPNLSFRSRLTIGLVAGAVLPIAGFGLLVLISDSLGGSAADPNLARLVIFAIALAALLGVGLAYTLAADLTEPLRAIAAAVERVSAGDLSTPIVVPGDDEVSRLADSHNRLASDLERRNRELERILRAIDETSPRDGVDWLVGRAANDAKSAFGLIDAACYLVDPREIPSEEIVPGESRPIRAELRAGGEPLGVLVGHISPTRPWERADQDLLELYASEMAAAIRNAQLLERVEAQNAQLLELDAAKDDFLRSVSHNLQTPLTSIRAYAQQLGAAREDRRLGIISEQADRLSRMVRQLLTVTRLESGALKPRTEVLALPPRVRRAWEALGASDVEFRLDDRSDGWLVVGDGDQVDQVLWALLDNAVKYGRGAPVAAEIAIDAGNALLRLTITDSGAGVPESDRGRLFGRFARGTQAPDEGSGLGLYVSRELCRAMDGDLVLEPAVTGRGASFSVYLPAELPEEI